MNYIPGQNYQFRYSLAVALVLHGLIVFGITIGAISTNIQLNQMEVTLSLSTSEDKPDDADFLAQTNQEGSGSADDAKEITVTQEALFADAEIRDVKPIVLPEEQSGANLLTQYRVITTTGDSELAVPVFDPSLKDTEQPGAEEVERKTLAELSLEIASLEARLAEKKQANNKRPRVLRLTSASTLAAANAEYVHQWRDRVETVGNLHYPVEAREKQLYGDVRLLVKVLKSGVIEEVSLLSSSGSHVLDRAAIESIHLASPFEPFPPALADQYDRIDVIRTWQFRKNRVTSKSS